MALTRLGIGLCVANLHASADRARAEDELIEAARIASGFAGGAPLILGGDYNLRPALSRPVFDRLEAEHGLRSPTGDRVIDHLLARGLEIVEPAAQWAPERREVPDPTGVDGGGRQLPVRLSDHAPVEARFERDAGG
jgi:endonuclease/exonuclease/phosphatase (EEP) superfamily protein YafD